MLKRDGEDCEHPVPNYPGLLTASEYKAYQAGIPLVAEQVRLHNERINILTELEKQIPEIADKIAVQKVVPLISTWQLRQTLFKTARGEMTICSRNVNKEEQFGIIERLDPDSPLARAKGDSQEIMRGNNAYLVLQNFVEGERSVLELFRKDIAANVDEQLAEMFPNLNNKRVVRAIVACCEGQAPMQSEQEAPARNAKIRM